MKQTQDRIIRTKELINLTGLSRTTLWRLERDRQLPRRRRISYSAVGWRLSEIEEWIETRQAA